MTEITNDSCRPEYKNELSNFKKETLKKVEEFRAARNNWIQTYSNQTVNPITKEGLYKSNEYKGRCALLRRIRFKTTHLRVHHKTLRPLKFYTFKQKLSDTEIEKVINESLEKSKICAGKYAKLNENVAPVDYLPEKSAKKGKSKRNESDNSTAKKIFPGKKASKKLKASIDSCKCKGGKGLTVVIKGVCLCDKTALNKLTLGKVCDEYSKLESKNTEPVKPKLSRTTDSLELYRKKSRNRLEKIKEKKEDTITQLESPSKKHVTFKHRDRDAKVGRKLIKNDDKVPTYKSASTNTKCSPKTPLIDWSRFKKKCKQKIIKEKDQSNGKINIIDSQTKKNLVSKQKNITEDLLKTTKEKTENNDANESIITLFRNKPQKQSDLGLTEEQYQKIKKVLKQNNEKIKK